MSFRSLDCCFIFYEAPLLFSTLCSTACNLFWSNPPSCCTLYSSPLKIHIALNVCAKSVSNARILYKGWTWIFKLVCIWPKCTFFFSEIATQCMKDKNGPLRKLLYSSFILKTYFKHHFKMYLYHLQKEEN